MNTWSIKSEYGGCRSFKYDLRRPPLLSFVFSRQSTTSTSCTTSQRRLCCFASHGFATSASPKFRYCAHQSLAEVNSPLWAASEQARRRKVIIDSYLRAAVNPSHNQVAVYGILGGNDADRPYFGFSDVYSASALDGTNCPG